MSFEITSTPGPNHSADTAWACTVYSLVPYLGILFVPIALTVSALGFVRTRRELLQDRRRFLLSAASSTAILAVQIFLWWLLYLIPEIGI
jgi:hypothetical protein